MAKNEELDEEEEERDRDDETLPARPILPLLAD